MTPPAGPLVLVVVDGFGIAPPGPGNAVSLARTPALDALAREGSACRIQASGLPVGLPDGQQGNSEVGHLNLGAGRRVPQMLVRVDEAVADGSLAGLPALQEALRIGRERALHLVGLVGDGGVHASQRHLLALLDAARAAGVERCYVHALTDGRDTRPDAALAAVTELEAAGATGGDDLRALLRDGPRPALGPHAQGLRRDGARGRRAGRDRRRRDPRVLRRRDERRVHRAGRGRARVRGPRARRRRGRLLELPRRTAPASSAAPWPSPASPTSTAGPRRRPSASRP